jgi:hypothetical protein
MTWCIRTRSSSIAEFTMRATDSAPIHRFPDDAVNLLQLYLEGITTRSSSMRIFMDIGREIAKLAASMLESR